MSQYELAKFASDVEKAFALVGGEKSKGIYDWMLFQFEQQRIIKLLEEHEPVGFIDGTVECSCKSTTPYQLHLIALIKEERK